MKILKIPVLGIIFLLIQVTFAQSEELANFSISEVLENNPVAAKDESVDIDGTSFSRAGGTYTCATDGDCSYSTCNCNQPYGVLTFVGTFAGNSTFSFTGVPDETLVMIRFNKSDLNQITGKDCKLTIGDQEVITVDDEYLEEENFFYLTTPETVRMERVEAKDCSMTVYYSAVKPKYFNYTKTETSGTLTGPIESDPNSPNADLGYMEQVRMNYQFLLPENHVIEFTISELDLGYRGDPVHSHYAKENTIKNDLLLIGIEDETGLQLDNYLLFGHLNGTVKVKVVSPNAYVAFVGSYHENVKPKGFIIDYKSHKVDPGTTIQTTSTTTVPNFGSPASGFIPLNSATKGYDTTTEMEQAFKIAMAELATEYVARVHLNMEDPQNITAEDIMVNEVVDCLPTICNEYCAAFDFSIFKFNSNQSAWAFDDEELDRMIYNEEAAVYWKIIGDECQYCDENVQINWLVVGFGCLFIFIIVLVILGFAWNVSQEKSAKESRERNTLNTELEEEELKRRPSDDILIIGQMKGGMRISLPFASRNPSLTSTKTVTSEMNYDTSGFVDVDTDFGYENFGLGPELIRDRGARSFYGNPAFVPDSPTKERKKYQQLQNHSDVPSIDFMGPSTSTDYNAKDFVPPPAMSKPIKSAMKKSQKPEKKGNLATFQEESDDEEDEHYSKSPKKVMIEAEVHNDVVHQTSL